MGRPEKDVCQIDVTGFGELSKAQMERSTDLIQRAGDHLSLRISRQILPRLSILGWQILVLKTTLGADQLKNEQIRHHHGVIIREQKFGIEMPILIGGIRRPVDFNKEMLEVVGVGSDVDANNLLLLELLGFFYDSWSGLCHNLLKKKEKNTDIKFIFNEVNVLFETKISKILKKKREILVPFTI